LRLLKLPPDIQIALRDNILTMGHARALLGLENPDGQILLFKRIIQEDLSVRRVEDLVRDMSRSSGKSSSSASTPNRDNAITQLQSKLSSHFGTRVLIKNEGGKGEIRIPYLSVEDLNRILEILKV